MRLYRRRDSDQWWVDFKDPDGNRRRRPAGRSKREAENALESIRTSILAGTYFNDCTQVKEHAARELTLKQLWEEYRAGRSGVSASTWKDDKVRIERVLLPFFGSSTSLGALTPASFAKFVRWRLEKGLRKKSGVAKSTVSRDLSIVRSMWQWGMRFLPNGIPPCPIPKNSELKLPYQSPPRIDFYSCEELDVLLAKGKEYSPDRILPVIGLGAFGGLRRGEMVHLPWTDVDLESFVLHVRNSSRDGEEHRTKNEEDRIVPIRPRLAEILRELQDAQLAGGGLPELVLPVNRKGGAIFSFQGAWKRFIKRCGIRYLPVHCLRHTCASHMVMAGVPLISVARFLGHKSTKMTERYAHLAPEHLSDEMRRVESWHKRAGRRAKRQKKAAENGAAGTPAGERTPPTTRDDDSSARP